MAKRKRKERRQRQQSKAFERGDFGAIRAMAQRNSETGASALTTALKSGKVDPNSPEVAALADSLAEPLRSKGRHDALLALAACFPEPSAHLRLARALSAIALGQDDIAAQDAKSDPVVGRALAPLLAALRGKPIPRTPTKSPRPIRSITAFARAVSAMRTGSTAKARTALRSVDKDWQPRLGCDELQRFLDMQAKRLPWFQALGLMRHTLRLRLVRQNRVLRRSIARILLPRFPEMVLDLIDEFQLPREDVAALSVSASIVDEELDSEQARVSRLIASVGASAFDPEHRPVALLFEAFQHLRSNPKMARDVFDAAIAAGADMAEALRGRGYADLRIRQDKEGLKTFMRLAKILERDDDGRPLAFAAARKAARGALQRGDNRLARDALAIAQQLAEGTAWLDTDSRIELLTMEHAAWLRADRDRAMAALETAASLAPNAPGVWYSRISQARSEGRNGDADELVLEAAKLHVSDDFVAQAREIRMGRGERWTPESGATAGELAAEMHARLLAAEDTEEGPVVDDLLACRESLPVSAKIAFDMARYASMSVDGVDDEASKVLENAYRDPDVDPAARDAWLLFAADFSEPAVIPWVVERAKRDPNDPIVVLAYQRLVMRHRPVAQRLRAHLAPHLSRSQMQRFTPVGASRSEDALREYLRPFESALRPHYSLFAVLNGDPPVAGLEDGDDGDDDDEARVFLELLLNQMGESSGFLERLSPLQRAEALEIAAEMMRAKSPGEVRKIGLRLRRILAGPPSFEYEI